MQTEEQRLIDGLYSRLQQAEQNSGPRDNAAESLIKQHLQNQPQAPYYMTQTLLIQEAALRQLNAKIEALQQQVSALQSRKPESGGFLSGLFGGGGQSSPASSANAPIPGNERYNNNPPPAPVSPSAPRSSGFMAGALQTAAGVAGGIALGNMLTGLFQHSHPEEIVNIIEPPDPQDSASQASFLPEDTDANWAPKENDGWGQDSRDNEDNNPFLPDDNDDNGDDDDSSWI